MGPTSPVVATQGIVTTTRQTRREIRRQARLRRIAMRPVYPTNIRPPVGFAPISDRYVRPTIVVDDPRAPVHDRLASLMRNRSPPRMIEAYKHGWPRKAVDALIQSRMRGGFHSIRAQGLDRGSGVPSTSEPGGTLFLANHSCWWDLFFVHYWNEAIPVDGYGMMEHFNMLRFGLFRRIGAFSVDRTDPVAVRTGRSTMPRSLLNQPRSGVWIFPQGKIEGNDARPLDVPERHPGRIVRRVGRVRVVPVAFLLRVLAGRAARGPRPVRRADLGRPVRPTARPRPHLRGVGLTAELDALKVDAVAQAYRPVRGDGGRAGKSISERYAAVRARGSAAPHPGAPA